ncbi:MAG: PAS domain S-box protein [bacterium]|nr:PAS domain S-box protein [bacterium]
MDASLAQKLVELQEELTALKEINRALMSRVERSTDHAGGSFSLFESNIVLQHRIKERTQDLQQSKARLEAEFAEHKRTESELRKLQEHTRQIIDTALDAVIAFDRNWKIVDWNPRAENTFGYDAASALESLNVEALIAHGGHSTLRRYLAERIDIEERGVRALELIARHRDGHEFPVEVSVSVLLRDDEPPLFSAFIRDITERKLAEEARYRTLFDNSPVALMELDAAVAKRYVDRLVERGVTDLRGHFAEHPEALDFCVAQIGIADVNLAATRLFRVKRKQHFIEHHPDYFKAGETELFLESLIEVTSGHAVYETEAALTMTDGQVIHVLMNLSLAPGHRESWAKVFVSMQDISDRKNAEQEKAQLEAQLHHAQKMDTIGTLAGGIAHDFNNMLTPILGYAELLSDPVNSAEESKAATDHIIFAAKRARDLVRQILTFSRQVEQELKPIALEPCVREALELVRASLPTTVRMNVTLASLPGAVLADPTQIHQVLLNLCTNAYQSMETGVGAIEVSLQATQLQQDIAARSPQLRAGQFACLSVTDNGCGIEPHLLSRIFEPFFTTKEVGKGTGMGLAVTHGIVRKHGGDVIVQSVPGEGSCFHVYLPLVEAVETGKLPIVPQARSGHERILVVDDDPLVAVTTSKQLEKLGYIVTTLTDSRQALAAFSGAPLRFDLVMTDLAMPNLPGQLLANELRKIRPDIPVILLTGHCNLVTEETARSLGICRILFKPSSASDLSAAIREALAAAPA